MRDLDQTTATVTPSSASVSVDTSGGTAVIKIAQGAWNIDSLCSTLGTAAEHPANPVIHSLTYAISQAYPTVWTNIDTSDNLQPDTTADSHVSTIMSWAFSVPAGYFLWLKPFMKYAMTDFLPDLDSTDFATCITRADESGLGPEPGDLAVRLMATCFWNDVSHVPGEHGCRCA
jgi:hypothetical protein